MEIKARPTLGFRDAVKLAISRKMEVKGRSRRSEFWWFMVFMFIVNIVVSILTMFSQTLSTVVGLLVLLLCVPVTVRRLHDRSHSAWWVYLCFLSVVFINVYILWSGVIDMMNSVNADLEEIYVSLMTPVYAIPSFIATITSIAIFIFALLDSDAMPNKYGESPKYYIEGNDEPAVSVPDQPTEDATIDANSI